MSPQPSNTTSRPEEEDHTTTRRLWSAGRTAWAIVGVALALALLGYVLSTIPLVVVPAILALFPATLLVPVANWLKRIGVPGALAALISIVGGILLIVGIFVGLAPVVIRQLPELTESAAEGLRELQESIETQFGIEIGGVSELMEAAREQMPEAGELAAQASQAAIVAFETIAGIVLMLVILFFYLKDGRGLKEGVVSLLPDNVRPHASELADRSWNTLGSYFRGQMLVALADAVFIGIGLIILGVPLALPLAVLIFFGGLFPIVGAVATGTLAVLVAFADGGLVLGLIVLGLVLLVQQLEGNVLEPLILSQVIHLHPLVILLSITAGGLLLGILGAFLAVPTAAILSKIFFYLRKEVADGGPEAGEEEQEREEERAGAVAVNA